MTNVIQVDTEKLNSLFSKSKTAKAMKNYFFSRKRGRQDTNVRRIERSFKEFRVDFEPAEISQTLKEMQDLGLGKIVFGRHGNPTRFMWTANLRSIKDVLEGKSQSLNKQKPTAKKLNQAKLVPNSGVEKQAQPVDYGSLEPVSSQHRLIVRKGTIEIEVPAALTLEEAKGAAALLSVAS